MNLWLSLISCVSSIVLLVLILINLRLNGSEDRRRRRLRRQRLFIYAQLAEQFVEWGGVLPRATREFDPEKGGFWYSLASDKFGVGEPKLEAIAGSDELRERVVASLKRGTDGELASPGYDEEKLLDLRRRQALVITCDGVVGPLPYIWVRRVFALDRKGEPCAPRLSRLDKDVDRGDCRDDGSQVSKDTQDVR